jgi:hypothetical protein
MDKVDVHWPIRSGGPQSGGRVAIKAPGLIWLPKEDLHRGRRHQGRDFFSELNQLSALVQRDIENFFSPTLEKGPIGLRCSLAEGDRQPSPGSEQSQETSDCRCSLARRKMHPHRVRQDEIKLRFSIRNLGELWQPIVNPFDISATAKLPGISCHSRRWFYRDHCMAERPKPGSISARPSAHIKNPRWRPRQILSQPSICVCSPNRFVPLHHGFSVQVIPLD